MMGGDERTEGGEEASFTETVAASPLDPDSERFAQSLVENTAVGQLTVDGGGTIVFANPALGEVLGYDPAALVGQPLQTLVPDRVADRYTDSFDQYIETGERPLGWSGVELDARHEQGHEIPVVLDFREHHHDGQWLFTGVLRGRTDRLDRERTLRAREQQFRSLVDAVEGYAICRLDPQGSVETWNRGAAELTGYEAPEILGQHLSVFYPTAAVDAGLPAESLSAATAEGTVEYEGWRVRKDGTQFWASVTLTAIRDDSGEVTGFAKVVQDLTQKRREERRRQLLAAVSRRVADAETAERGLRDALETLCEQGRWDRGEMWLPTADGGTLGRVLSVTAADETDDTGDTDNTELHWPDGRSTAHALAERVSQDGESAWVVDGGEDGDTVHPEPTRVGTALGVPIEADGAVVAVVVLGTATETDPDETLRETVELAVGDLGVVVARLRAETELERERAFLDQLLETSPVGILVAEPDGTVCRVNDHTEQLFGRPKSAIVGQHYTELVERINDDDGARIPPETFPITRAFEREEPVFDYQFGITRVDGEERWLSVSSAPVRTSAGTVERVVAAVRDITTQKQRERTLERQRRALQRIRQVTESLRPLNRALVRASTHEEIEQVVCEQLATSDAYQFAWYGSYNPTVTRVTPKAWSGFDVTSLDEVTVTTGEGDHGWESLGAAIETRTVSPDRTLEADEGLQPWPTAVPRNDIEASAVVPVVFDETIYGVVGLYSDRPNAFDEYEQALLRELGERVGHALNAAKNKQLLHTDTAVELEFRTTTTEDACVATALDLGCRLSLETLVPTTENRYIGYLSVEGAAPERVCERLADAPTVDAVRVVYGRGSTGTVEYVVKRSLATALMTYGATIRSFVVDSEVGTVRAEVAPEADIHELSDGVRAAYGETSFVAKRTIDRAARELVVGQRRAGDVLTERQAEVLELAYHAGFFESPRESTGEELASSLGISSPTFYVHVRNALRKILAHLVEQQDLR